MSWEKDEFGVDVSFDIGLLSLSGQERKGEREKAIGGQSTKAAAAKAMDRDRSRGSEQ